MAAAFPRRDVAPALAADLTHGRPIPAAGLPGTYGVFAPDGQVLALVRERDELARAAVVLAPANQADPPCPEAACLGSRPCSGGVGSTPYRPVGVAASSRSGCSTGCTAATSS